MTSVGNFTVYTYVTVGGTKSSSIASSSSLPKHVVEIRNCSTLDYTVKVSGQVNGNPPKVEYPGGNTYWTSPSMTVFRRKRVYAEKSLIYKGITRGYEDLACTELEEQSMHSSGPTSHSNLGISVTINLV